MSKKHNKQPKDLGLKVGTKEQVIFEELAKNAKLQIDNQEKSLIANKAILAMCEKRIEEEKKKGLNTS